ncbi:MAG: SUMF1/EgtB/PvdO family nonheme iron enzyme [Nitrospira sp.]|nr:SUMF1/EgtB/PvdO family nonheme iron enzyme [Nitrospira sp.]
MKRAGVSNIVVVWAVVLVGLLAGETEAAFRNPDGVAVIIGNRTYEHGVTAVTYAHRDADAFRRYVIDVLGFDPENVIHKQDTDKVTLERTFGNRDRLKGSELWRHLHPEGHSDVVVFYSGHGIPGANDQRGYLLPVNAHPDTAELEGYPIDVLYRNLGKLQEQGAARAVQVFLDACFSGDSGGGPLLKSISAIGVAPLQESADVDTLTILTAASGEQRASWDHTAKHGLFTHHLLEALYGKGDANADGRVTAAEAKAYLDRHMTRAARKLFGRVQNADLRGQATAVLARSLEGMFPVRPDIVPVRQAGERFRDCPTCPEMVVVPAGRFQMGDSFGVGTKHERPVHDVTINYQFAVGRYEVTRGQFARFVEAAGYSTAGHCWKYSKARWNKKTGDDGWRNPGYSQTNQHPVVCVSWEDAQEYVRWLSRETGKPYRLLSEAEWEYVARAGTTTKYWWGNTVSHDYANYGMDKCCDGFAAGEDRWVYTSPVGSFKANAFGVFDTAGNAAEWVEDCWYDDYEGAPADGSAWTKGERCGRKVRGSSWGFSSRTLRSSYNWKAGELSRDSDRGFRVARTLTGSAAMLPAAD